MKQTMRDRQRDLFEIEDPPPPLPPDRREKVLRLIQALLLETTVMSPAVEDRYDQDHA
jgi:hypothetical protein